MVGVGCKVLAADLTFMIIKSCLVIVRITEMCFGSGAMSQDIVKIRYGVVTGGDINIGTRID